MDSFTRVSVTAADGLELAAYDRPGPRPGAPVLFLSNGLGGNLPTWRHLIRWFGGTHRIVSWDYRGLYGSALPPELAANGVDLSVPAHASDAIRVAEALGVGEATFVGWSMGVQLNFELSRLCPERIEAIVALSGGFGRVFSHTVIGRAGAGVLQPGMDVFRRVMEALGGPILKAADGPLLLPTMKRLGLVGRTLDEEVFQDLVREYVRLDFGIYNRIMAGLDEHDAEEALAGVRVPVLIIAGDKDPMTPHWVSEKMRSLLRDSELMILPLGTHYLPVEFPEMINLRVEKFLRTRVGHTFEA